MLLHRVNNADMERMEELCIYGKISVFNTHTIIFVTHQDLVTSFIVEALLKQSKLEHFLVTNKVQHILPSSIQCQYSQTIMVISTVTAQLFLLDCLPSLLLTAQNGLVFIPTEAFNSKYNQLTDTFLCVF